MRNLWILTIPLIMVFALSCNPEVGEVEGVVQSSNLIVLEGATVEIDGKSTTSDAQGKYSIKGIDAGRRTVRANYPNAPQYEASENVSADDAKIHDITMEVVVESTADTETSTSTERSLLVP